jgi:hypothetical protein
MQAASIRPIDHSTTIFNNEVQASNSLYREFVRKSNELEVAETFPEKRNLLAALKNLADRLSFDVHKIDFDITYFNHTGRDPYHNVVPESQYNQFSLFKYRELTQMRARANFCQHKVLEIEASIVRDMAVEDPFFAAGRGGDEVDLNYQYDPNARMYKPDAIEWIWEHPETDIDFRNFHRKP